MYIAVYRHNVADCVWLDIEDLEPVVFYNELIHTIYIRGF